MQKKKIFILLGHPDEDSFNGTLAMEYEKGALEAGHEIRRQNVGEMVFDPILHHAYKTIQELEPDLKAFQENVKWCDHFVIVYPIWFSTMPAVMKGLFDRAWLPGFAFKFHKSGLIWSKLLRGRSASMIVTSDNIPIVLRLVFGDSTNEVRRGLLWFTGFSPIHVHSIGFLKFASMARHERTKRKIYILGMKAK